MKKIHHDHEGSVGAELRFGRLYFQQGSLSLCMKLEAYWKYPKYRFPESPQEEVDPNAHREPPIKFLQLPFAYQPLHHRTLVPYLEHLHQQIHQLAVRSSLGFSFH
ncbi:hypothetical protein Tco_0817453 [Tanacetum coccineum]